MEKISPGRTGSHLQDSRQRETKEEKRRLPSKEAARTSFLEEVMRCIPERNFMEAVNSMLLYDVGEDRKRHYMGHLLITNEGNKNLLGPHYARWDENGDGWYLSGWRHFVLKEAHYYTGVYYLLFGKVYVVDPYFDREPKAGYDNLECPICHDKWLHSVHNCQKMKANVCENCCSQCKYNEQWHCNFSVIARKRKAAAKQ